MDFQPLKYILELSKNPNAPVLVLLHGTGGDEQDLIPLAKDITKDFHLLSLRGNVNEGGMPRFFRRIRMGVFDEKDLAFRTDEMKAFIEKVLQENHLENAKLVALGYSNGANIAGATLLNYPDFFDGAILFRPMLPFQEPVLTEKAQQVPVFFSNGKHDPTVPPKDTSTYLEILKEQGFEVEHHALPTSHNLTYNDVELAKVWLERYFPIN